MQKIEPKDIQAMLDRAAKSLTQSRDQELMMRLVASTNASESSDWDYKLIAAMLAKAGKMGEAEAVVGSIPSRWERADAFCSVAKALFEIDDKKQALNMLASASKESADAQDEGSEQEQQCAAGVLADVSELYAIHKDFAAAERVAQTITHAIRQQRAMERITELRAAMPEPEPQPKKKAAAKAKAKSKPKAKK